MPPKRMTANPARPQRHRAGRGHDSSSSDSEGSDADSPSASTTKAPIPPPPKAISAGKIISNLGKVDLSASKRNEALLAEQRRTAAAAKAERLAAASGFVTASEEESEDDSQNDGESGSSEQESSDEEEEESEEEAPRRLMLRPKFVPKSQRGKDALDLEKQQEAAFEAQEAAKKKAADALVEEQIRKDLAARAAGKKHWDDDENPDSEVDTTDGLDPAAEEAAWRVRELKRLKRSREAIEEKERELAEVERRRNLTEEERQAEDEAFLAKQQDEKDSKGKMSFMQKYHHKGAFFQEEAAAAGLLQRDLMGTRIADDVRNREALPAYLQKRDMTKLGKKGATKYRDMRSEDTGRWGDLDDRRRDGRYAAAEGRDDRFRADDERFKPDERDAKGANAIPLGDRETKQRAGGRGGDGNEDGRKSRVDEYRPRNRDLSRSRSRSWSRSRSRSRSRPRRRVRSRSRSISRSRTPPRERNDDRRRKRSTSRSRRGYEDKRRRVDD
ncbi:hypothetical protein E4U50_002892 [Claviceps purpurea]|nr:hypothetical protein E4U50_002892 [Claviceps purpurea]